MNLHLLDWLLPDPDEFDTEFNSDREWSAADLKSLRPKPELESEPDDRTTAD